MSRSKVYHEICLCNSCAGVFFRSPHYRISRVDPIQVIKDTCDCCRVRRGYDFYLCKKALLKPSTATRISPPVQTVSLARIVLSKPSENRKVQYAS
jgi:hypothetical protein